MYFRGSNLFHKNKYAATISSCGIKFSLHKLRNYDVYLGKQNSTYQSSPDETSFTICFYKVNSLLYLFYNPSILV